MRPALSIAAIALLISAFQLFSFSAFPPVPPTRYRPATGVTAGSGAALLITKATTAPKITVIVPPAARTNTILWRFAPGSTNYLWNLQTSTNLKTWTTLRTNVTGPVQVTNNLRESRRFYRLAGHH